MGINECLGSLIFAFWLAKYHGPQDRTSLNPLLSRSMLVT